MSHRHRLNPNYEQLYRDEARSQLGIGATDARAGQGDPGTPNNCGPVGRFGVADPARDRPDAAPDCPRRAAGRGRAGHGFS